MTELTIETVSAGAEATHILDRVSGVLKAIPRGFQFTKNAEWVAIPVERSMHFSEPFLERTVQAFAAAQVRIVYAVALELQDTLIPVYRVPASAVGFAGYNRECGQFDYVVFPPQGSAIILCSASGDYLVVAGPAPFVESVAGTSLRDAYMNFQKYAEDPAWTPRERRFFLDLLCTLRDSYASAANGTAVTFQGAST